MERKDTIKESFKRPTSLPESEQQSRQWQEENRQWWENHPMRYDWKKSVSFEEFSEPFFQEVDRRFFLDLGEFMPWDKTPFDPLIDYEGMSGKDVLEIGTGIGSVAQLLAKHSKSYTGIDITNYAVKGTSERMKCFGISNAKIIRMDAEKMQFDDNAFDYIWSWGVIHHSSNTDKILGEMKRVLRPGGIAVTMVYHRNLFYYLDSLLRGVVTGDLFKKRSFHKIVQKYVDGAIARFYTIPEWRSFVSQYFDVKGIQIYGSKTHYVLLPPGRIKNAVMSLIPNSLSRSFTNRCKMGIYLVSILEKK